VELPKREDDELEHVIINEKAKEKNSKYAIEGVPFPYTSREEYERAMKQPLGREWNSQNSYNTLTQPEVKTRLGTIIDPIKLPETKQKRF
jgi:U3 small nucleolar RNA-associated protein 14